MNTDIESIILGEWLHGQHLEDMRMFEPRHFPRYGKLFEKMKSGETNKVKLAKTSETPVGEVALLTERYYPAMYENCMDALCKEVASEWLQNHQSSEPEEILKGMKMFTRRTETLPEAPKDPVMELIDEFDRIAKEKPVSTGLTQLDYLLCGVRKKEFTAVGARPSVGKSAFVQQIGMEVARQGYKVLFFPLEMSQNAIMKRMFMKDAEDVTQYEMRNGLKPETWAKNNYTLSKLNDFMDMGTFLIYERCNDLRKIRGLIKRHKPHMIIIDQLEQLKDGNRSWPDKRARFSHMTHELQAISLDMDVAVWLACQVNRGADNTPPTMANLKESGTIEEDATNVILLHRDGDKTEMQRILLDLAKQKDGQCGTIELTFNAPRFTFYGTE